MIQQYLNLIRYVTWVLLLSGSFNLFSQSPAEIAEKICSKFQKLSKFELVEKPLDHIQQGVLVMRPTRMDALDVETIITVNELGGRFVNMTASPGRMKVWRDDEVIFDGRSVTQGTPVMLDQGIFKSEFRYPLPPFPGDYQIRIEYYPEGESSTIYLWLTDEKGNVQHNRSFRSDWGFMETYLYRFKPRASDNELDWQFPTEPPSALQFESQQNDWHYATGMMLDAIAKASDYFTTFNHEEFVQKHLDFYVTNFDKISKEKASKGALQSPFHRYFRYQQLDDFGPQTVPFLNAAQSESNKRFVSRGLSRLLYKAVRLRDGTYARYSPDSLSVWAEDLYMSVVLLSRAYEKNKSPKYLLEAINQTILYNRHLKDRKSRLYAHGYFAENVEQSAGKWARANALVVWANVELLKAMPVSHPDRESILRIYRAHAASLRELQSLDGRWRQVLNNDTSYLETSASALFVAAFAEGLENEWLFNKAEFRQSAIKGWVAITEQVDVEGNVSGISPETPILYSDEEYEKLAPIQNHPLGLAAVLYAAIAVDRLQRSD